MMDYEFYGLFFLLILFALLGCGIAYACLWGYSCLRKRTMQNELRREDVRHNESSDNRHATASMDSELPISSTSSRLMDRPLHTFVPISNWPVQAWPMQNGRSSSFIPQSHFTITSNNTEGETISQINLNNASNRLGSTHEHPFFLTQEEYCHRPRFNSNDLPPSYEEAMLVAKVSNASNAK